MRRTQIAVVGGGPAGLAAAAAAAGTGAEVVLFDENPMLGGQLRYRIAEVSMWGSDPIRPHQLAESAIVDARAAGVELRTGAVVWGLFAGPILAVSTAGASFRIAAERIVLAIGSTDLPFPFAGGTLPGVMTARAVQLLLHLHRVLPGRRFAVIGARSEAVEVADDIAAAGGEVVVRIDPDLPDQAIVAEGEDGVRRIITGGRTDEVDAVAVAVGRQPDAELALMAECEAAYDAQLGGFVPLRDPHLRSSVPGIMIAGDCGGVCDVPTAFEEGRLAGLSAASSLGLVDEEALRPARSVFRAGAAERARAVAALVATAVRV
jgi:thioredoxin reductase